MTDTKPESKPESKLEKKPMPRTVTGIVASDKGDKSIVVLVERKIKHPVYKKYIRRSTKLHAHDADNTASKGDLVVIQECRPVSKMKKWRLLEIKQKAV